MKIPLPTEKPPNIALCVLSAMQELKDIGLGGGRANNTHSYANGALGAYNRAEKNRCVYLAARTTYEKRSKEFLRKQGDLIVNLVERDLDPLLGTSYDPLKWYLTASEVIKLCKGNGVILKLTTLRKYQAFGLIPKPIRIGRVAGYSVLTALRVGVINTLKKRGLRLGDIQDAVAKSLNETLTCISDTSPEDRTPLENTCLAMLNLIDNHTAGKP